MGHREEQEEKLAQLFADQYGIGYGRLMQIWQKLWREYLVKIGGNGGGEFAIGPCVAMLVPCQCVEDEEPELEQGRHCGWCCGTHKVTERVRLAQKHARAS